MKARSKKFFAVLLVAAMLVSTFAIGCGSEDKPTETVNKFCTSLLAYDIKTAVSYTNDTSSNDSLDLDAQIDSDAGKVILNCVKELAKKNSFKITNEEKTDSTHYKVTVTFTLQDLSTLQNLITTELSTLVKDLYSSTGNALNANNEEDYKKIVELMGDASNKVVKEHTFATESHDISFNLEKVNDKWLIMDPDSSQMTHILMMGISGL